MTNALAALLLPLFADPTVLNATLRTEARGGESPLLGTATSQTFAASVILPDVEGEVHDRRLDLRLAYAPRLVWYFLFQPDAATATPSVLHEGRLTLSALPSRTSELSARLGGSIGKPDYAYLPQLLGNGMGQAAVPNVSTILGLSGSATFRDELTRRWRLALSADAYHFQSLGGTPPAPAGATAPALPSVTSGDATAGLGERLSDITEVSGTATANVSEYSNGVELLALTPRLVGLFKLPTGDTYRVSVGVTYARDLGSRPALPSGPSLFPTASIDGDWHLMSRERYGVWARLWAAVEEYVDPVLALSSPRGFASGDVRLVVAPDWSLAVAGEFWTSFRGVNAAATTPGAPLATAPDETYFSVAVPIRRRLGTNATLELGGRWSERAPLLTTPDFAFRERQLWAYVALTVTTIDALPYPSH